MKISLEWLSELVAIQRLGASMSDVAAQVAEVLTQRGLEVESVLNRAQGFDRVVTARVLEKNRHPQADRLSVCKVDFGGEAPLSIVCGAQNFQAGDCVALAQVGAHLPNGMKIVESKIRGELSQGMLCSEEELKLKDSSEGILILAKETALGLPLAEVLGLSDVVLELKITANRGDCLSHWGIAREMASHLVLKFGGKPADYLYHPTLWKSEEELSRESLAPKLQAGEDSNAFFVAAVEGVTSRPSSEVPPWMRRRLESCGMRSIHSVVDATNYLLLELGHPVHAYDLKKLPSGSLAVRRAREGEKVALLDGSEVSASSEDLLIVDSTDVPQGLAGVMGGGRSEVSETTNSILLECAEFHPVRVRRTKSRHHKMTEAAHRFERGVDLTRMSTVIARLVELVRLSSVKDPKSFRVLGLGQTVSEKVSKLTPIAEESVRREIEISKKWLREFLGFQIESESWNSVVRKTLESLEFRVGESGSEAWRIGVPHHRLDVNLREDVAEEIARVMGYDRLPSRVPALTTPPQGKWNLDSEQSRAGLIDAWKDAWVSLGFQESLNFGFTSESWLKTLGLIEPASTEGKHWIRVLNPLSEEHAVMVPSLLPGLLRNAIDQWRHHFGSEPSPVRLFEIRPTFFKPTPGPLQALDESRTGAQEVWKVSFLVSGPVLSSGLRTDLREVDFFDLKGAVESWLEAIGARGIRMREASATGLSSFFHPTQSVEILAGRSSAGWFGALHPELALKLKVRSPLYLGEFEVGALSEVSRKVTDSPAFRAWSEFPGMERDFAVLIREGVRADQVVASIQKSGKPLVHSVKVFDIYRGAQIQAEMTSLAVRVIFQGEGRVLQEVETEEVSRKIVDALKQDLGAELR